tara:strand:- start:424 stop:714 length:291 start_codon:yes stop_codon:yes gene_type:complete
MKSDTYKLAKTVRLDVLNMVNKGSSSHVGSALSCTDLIIGAYSSFLHHDAKDPESDIRDILYSAKVMPVQLCMQPWQTWVTFQKIFLISIIKTIQR